MASAANNIFDTFQEAKDYLIRFLAQDAPLKGTVQLNEPYDIGGATVEIRTYNHYQ